MDEIRFYLAIFLRRLHWFLIVATIISASAVMVAFSLPPAYVSRMTLAVESPQIPEELAASTVQTPILEQLQIIEQRLMTRGNMLAIARELNVFPDVDDMSPDQIVDAMRSRTSIRIVSGRGTATLMRVSFEAAQPTTAAAVLNEYLNIIQESDSEIRRDRAGGTLEFFRQEVQRLGEEIDAQSAEILAFQQSNGDALPDSFNFRMSKRSTLQENLRQIELDIQRLEGRRARLIQTFETTGQNIGDGSIQLSPDEQLLRKLETELNGLLSTFSEENPKVKLLRARIAQLESKIDAESMGADTDMVGEDGESETTVRARGTLGIQLSEIDGEIEIRRSQITDLQAQIDALDDTIQRSPEVASTLSEMQRRQEILGNQYKSAEERLARALTGDLIEARSRGQRISVIEQPIAPDFPTKPNRVLIAGGGTAVGVAVGLGLIVLLELLNSSLRRPEDMISRLGVTPFATIPYIRTRRQIFWQRGLKTAFLLSILVCIPAALYAVHVYYLPLDLVADKVMDKLGVRW